MLKAGANRDEVVVREAFVPVSPGTFYDRQPQGNPIVRDENGSCGNVDYGGKEIPSRNRKSRTGDPPPAVARDAVLSKTVDPQGSVNLRKGR